jgi:hypothetical protein
MGKRDRKAAHQKGETKGDQFKPSLVAQNVGLAVDTLLGLSRATRSP